MATQALTDLAARLAAAGVAIDAAGLASLVDGAASAPDPFGDDRWSLLLGAAAAPFSGDLDALVAARRKRGGDKTPLPARLAALRAELASLGVDGFLLQRTDEHGSEYLPASAERVAWLTGFTGSAGQVVVLADKAAIFVDGRYVEQVENEVDHASFDRVHLIETPPPAWLEANAPEGLRLGYDPLLTRKSEKERLEAVLKRKGGELVALARNPLDAVWRSRPAPPVSPVFTLDARYSGESDAAKRLRMGEAVAKAGATQLLVTAPDSIAWLLNIRAADIPFNPLPMSFALLDEDGACRLFIDPRKLPATVQLGNTVTVEPAERLMASLDAIGASGTKVLVDPATTHVGFTERLRAAGAVIVEGEDPCVRAKAAKNATELAGMNAAHVRDGAALSRFLRWIEREGPTGSQTEMSAAARLDAERAKDPLFRGPSFPSISGHGPHGSIMHYRVSEESDLRIGPDTLYLIDSGGQYLDATTDVTRTIAVGAPSEEMRRRFTLVLKGHIAIAEAVFPKGTNGQQLDSFARAALWREGLDFDHGTGHGVGSFLCVHEGPARIAKAGSAVALEPGMILSNEPGYYKPGHYGIRIENLLAVEAAPAPAGADRSLLRFHTLTLAPIDRRLIVTEILTAPERSWTDAYHARVAREIGPLLDGDDRSWLHAACAPLA